MKPGRREPDAALTFARRLESSSDSDSPDEIDARKTCSTENVPVAVIEVTSSTIWQEHFTTKWNEYGRTRMPKYVVAPRMGLRGEARGSISVGPQEPHLWTSRRQDKSK